MLNPQAIHKDKNISYHPLQNYIKNKYIDNLKCYHNSVNNPAYPYIQENKKNLVTKDRFTIIGIMTHEAYVRCAHWVKVLHKYKNKLYEAPILKGVTDVEWPKRWNDLKIIHGSQAYCIQTPVIVLLNDKLLGGSDEFFDYIEKRFNYHPILDIPKLCVDEFANYVKSSGRPCAYMHIAFETEIIGTLIFLLYTDIAPMTCENFLRLCNSRRGGYGGTPIHRIVKDGWIQCGGYGLKSTDLECENFIVPHDRRGLLCMANAGRHMDCSTQFFVLLQPSPWMDNRYVAFGQLIDGATTLEKIEAVPTYYESPKLRIRIAKAGILNLECQEIGSKRRTNDFIQSHIEDLVALGEWIWERVIDKFNFKLDLAEELLDRVFKILRNVKMDISDNKLLSNVHETQRFMRRKGDNQEQLERENTQSSQALYVDFDKMIKDEGDDGESFDIESYSYEGEHDSEHVSFIRSSDIVEKKEIPYYLPLSDVVYPNEVSSDYNFLKLLKGDYCLESDLEPYDPKQQLKVNKSMLAKFVQEPNSPEASEVSITSEDEKEMRRYIKLRADTASFSGGLIKNIAKVNNVDMDILNDIKTRSRTIADEGLRTLRSTVRPSKIVYVPVTVAEKQQHAARRRLTELMKLHKDDNEKTQSIFTSIRKVRILESQPGDLGTCRGSVYSENDDGKELARQSVMTRLYQDAMPDVGEDVPTLKDYKPLSEQNDDKMQLLTYSRVTLSENSTRDKYYRPSLDLPANYEEMLNLQHGKKIVRKISSDYVKTIDRVQHHHDISLRGIDYAKCRPSLTVEEYQRRNRSHAAKMHMCGAHKTASLNTIKGPNEGRGKGKNKPHGRLSDSSNYFKVVDNVSFNNND